FPSRPWGLRPRTPHRPFGPRPQTPDGLSFPPVRHHPAPLGEFEERGSGGRPPRGSGMGRGGGGAIPPQPPAGPYAVMKRSRNLSMPQRGAPAAGLSPSVHPHPSTRS